MSRSQKSAVFAIDAAYREVEATVGGASPRGGPIGWDIGPGVSPQISEQADRESSHLDGGNTQPSAGRGAGCNTTRPTSASPHVQSDIEQSPQMQLQVLKFVFQRRPTLLAGLDMNRYFGFTAG